MIEVLFIIFIVVVFILLGSNTGRSDLPLLPNVDPNPVKVTIYPPKSKPKKTVTFADERKERIFDVKTRKILVPERTNAT
jgi:hypothetical protein